MLSIKSLTHYIGGRALYEDLSLQIKPGEKIGFVGRNGTGKSTLFKIINRQIKPSYGSVECEKSTTIGFLNQELLSYQTEESIRNVAMQAFEEAIAAQREINEICATLEKTYSDELLERLNSLQEKFEKLGGYDMETKTDIVLENMGFKNSALHRPFNTFSGGWRMRLIFAKLLLQQPSLLLLDEPTNHLDIVSIQGVENYLRNYPNAVMVISHDRRFLDAVTSRTEELSQKVLHTYHGNYSFYEKEKAHRAITQQNAYKNQQKEIKKTQVFIDRFRAKSSKARSVQSRIKALDRMEKIAPVTEKKINLRVKFSVQQNPGRQVATLEHLSKAFNHFFLFREADAYVERGNKIALIGKNGKGKSTLLKILAQEITPDSGLVSLGHNVQIGFHTQHQLESLDPESTVLETLEKTVPDAPEPKIRALLGAFLFRKDDVYKPTKVLSGGEKARLSLAKTLVLEPNFLLLDEPTNHLDIEAIEVLAQALQKYMGTFIVVSHDRDFIQRIANKIWYLKDGQIKNYPGTYDEYVYWERALLH